MHLPGGYFFLYSSRYSKTTPPGLHRIAPFFAVKLGGYQQLVPFLLRGGHHIIVIRAAKRHMMDAFTLFFENLDQMDLLSSGCNNSIGKARI